MIKQLLTGVTAGIMAFAFTQSFAGDNLWKNFDGKQAPSKSPMNISADNYRIFSLDQQSMRNFLFSLDTNPDKAQQIWLPTPDKKFRSFHVWKTPMMEPGLAEKYPEIQTFTAVADDDPNVTAKLDYTLFGFRALVFDGKKTFMVDPYSNTPDGYYIAYYKSDLFPMSSKGACETGLYNPGPSDNGSPVQVGEDEATPKARVHGAQRRVYRLAISCTGEYAINAVGPGATKPQTISKIVSTINRVNGYYERELSVSMNIITGNDAIVYVNPATDPYACNGNLNCLIGEVQSNITAIIGQPNYDIGHILCTAGGGLAQLSAVCGGGKASGTSTSGGPEDIGTILHEMGHQFGANHTFSANSGGCNGNGNEETGYEPGAGITIMSYSGACAPNNVGADEDFFHVHNLLEINSFLSGQGGSCGTVNAGTAPVNLADLVDSFDIPRNTPFELMAPVATAPQANAVVTYSWEQYDTGNFGGQEENNGNATEGPIVRVYMPDTVRLRSYPTPPLIYDNSYSGPGLRLPQAQRTVRFKLVARSVYQGWGTFNVIDSVVRLKVSGAGPFRVTSQAAAETWNPGEVKEVTWAVAGTDADPVLCNQVNIYLSLDDGYTFPYLLVANAPNTGSYNVTIPDVYTTTGRIKVKGTGNVFYDINKAPLTINGTDPSGIKDKVLADALNVYPNPATDRIVVDAPTQSGRELKLVLFNTLGQKIWSGNMKGKTEIPSAAFARGNYLLQVSDAVSGALTTRKVVLN
jgi:hypothetical protein